MDKNQLTTTNELTPQEPYERLLIRIGRLDIIENNKSPLELFNINPCAQTLRTISKRDQTSEMVIAAINGEIQTKNFNGPILQYVSKKLLTPEICKLACYQHPDNLKSIPKNVVTKEMKKIANQTKRKLKEEEKRPCTPSNASSVPVRFPFEQSAPALFTADTSPASIPLPDVPKTKALVPAANDKMFHELEDISNPLSFPVYYISDIHLEHQLDLQGKTYPEIEELIESKVSELVDSIPTKKTPGIILIGGDTAHSVELESVFFRILRHKFSSTMPIIAVLGNHELWDGDPMHGSLRPVNTIIHNYRKGCACGILENNLWLWNQGNKPILLSERALLDASDDELSGLCNRFAPIILGGIGFSGHNPKFNASSGIYRNTVSAEVDAERSDRFKAVYDKVLRCAGSRCVIVLTHTPMENWSSNAHYNPNWVYVNGHTHINTLIRQDDGTTVLSDNQVGYYPKPWHFNCFTISGRYDIFANYDDGIYTIEPQQYRIFNQGQGIKANFKSLDQVYMVKRDGTYMFFQEKDRKTYMLAGGQRKSVTHDIQYYYNNLSRYKEAVKAAFMPYHSALQTLSKEVKQFGGFGTIHGCIVDIDFWNHIYLNPVDGKITPYFARDMIDKLMFSTVPDLLRNSPQPPERLLGNFKTARNRGKLPILTAHSKNKNLTLSTAPEVVLDLEMYEPSRTMRSVQYVLEQNIVRIWKEEVLDMLSEGNELDYNNSPLLSAH